jgi:hypothetical protein
MRTNLRKSVAALAAVGLFAVGCGNNNDTPGVEPEDVDPTTTEETELELGTEEDMTTTEEDMTTTEEDMGDVTEEDA